LLEDSNSSLLPWIEQRSDRAQEFCLIRLEVGIGLIEFTGGTQYFFVGAIRTLNQKTELLQQFQPTRADLKPVFNVLLYNRPDFCELIRIRFDDAMKLCDVKV